MLPVPYGADPLMRLAISYPPSDSQQTEARSSEDQNGIVQPNQITTVMPIDVEFDHQWEQAQKEEITPEDYASMKLESERCFGTGVPTTQETKGETTNS